MNPFDILGAVMQAGTSPSSGNRMGDVLGQMMGGMGAGGSGQAAPGGGMFDVLAKVAGSMMGGQGSAPGTMPGVGGGLPTDILKQVAGAVLGGNSPGGNGAMGAGSLAIFGTLAAQALEMAKGMMAGGPSQAGGMPKLPMDDDTAVMAGMRAPQTPQQQQQAMDVALLTLSAMMNAAKADGRLDEQEKARLLGKLQEGGISAQEQAFIDAEMQKPIDIDALARAVPNQQVAAQIYTASLMAIEVDTDGEKRYMADLAAKLRLDPKVVAYLHQAVGIG